MWHPYQEGGKLSDLTSRQDVGVKAWSTWDLRLYANVSSNICRVPWIIWFNPHTFIRLGSVKNMYNLMFCKYTYCCDNLKATWPCYQAYFLLPTWTLHVAASTKCTFRNKSITLKKVLCLLCHRCDSMFVSHYHNMPVYVLWGGILFDWLVLCCITAASTSRNVHVTCAHNSSYTLPTHGWVLKSQKKIF